VSVSLLSINSTWISQSIFRIESVAEPYRLSAAFSARDEAGSS
jgi:hypothetical protein